MPRLNNSLRLAASAAAIATSLLGTAAVAQSSTPGETAAAETEIVITGSRIARSDLENANPVVAVTGAAIEASGLTNITDVLLRNPALSASTGSSLSGGRDALFGETGVNLLNLRNLGTNRTLVLVNGKRHVAGPPTRRRSISIQFRKI
ncbi:MAG: TonB-dependent receptor plug domain-containing protein [Sphingopyxis sp.]|nr:TonB-dependent receptor plug domain-containing protein [Sphingopyxis sp.]